MAIHWMDRVWKESKADGAALLLLLKIADNANDKGMAYPGIEYLAQHIRMSERTVPRLVQKLEDMGELAVYRGKGRANTNRYYILVGRPELERKAIVDACKPPDEEIKPDKLSPFPEIKPDNLSPFSSVKPDKKSVKGDKKDVKPDIAMSPEPLTVLTPKEKDIKTQDQDPEPEIKREPCDQQKQTFLQATIQSMSFDRSIKKFIDRFLIRPEVISVEGGVWRVLVDQPPPEVYAQDVAPYLQDRLGIQLSRQLAAMACEGQVEIEFVRRGNGNGKVWTVLDAVPAAAAGYGG